MDARLSEDVSDELGSAGSAEEFPIAGGAQEVTANDALRTFMRYFRRSRFEQLNELFPFCASSSTEWLVLLSYLRRKFEKQGQLNLLLELLLSNIEVTFGHLALVAAALTLGDSLGCKKRVIETISRFNKSNSKQIVYWAHNDRLCRFKRFGSQAVKEMTALKYGVQKLDGNKLFDLADEYESRLLLPQALLDNLHNYSRNGDMPRRDWERHVRTAFCIDHITDDLNRVLDRRSPVLMNDLIDGEAKKEALRQIDPSQGVVLLSLHGGFFSVARQFIASAFEDAIAIQKSEGDDPRRIGVQNNPRAALFTALRALQDRKVLFIAADGTYGKTSAPINVLGIPHSVGIGAAFLAYEARCKTAWYSIIRKNDSFVPLIEPGPSRNPGESFEEFKKRLLDFVSESIESLVTGSPWNIALRSGWSELLNEPQRAAHAV